MGELPTGTVTMLFSDIEGSTVLLGRLGARYLEALDAHRAILRAAQLFGAEEAMHERLGIPNPYQDEEREEALDLLDGAMSGEEWDEQRGVGRQRPLEDLLAELDPADDVSSTVGR